jgi:branched-chain amino acid transport system substrate-binding protein
VTWLPTRRQLMAYGGAAASAGLIPSIARAQSNVDTLRIGAVFPSASGLSRVLTSVNDYIGSGGRQGSQLAEQRIGDVAAQAGIDLKVLQTSSPTPAAAIRAAERLVEVENIDVMLGGVGEGQLEVLLPIAEQAGIPIFNIGTPNEAFRQDSCSRYLFHMEASDAMYLDAMVEWSAAQGHRSWFVVHENNDRGLAMQARALKAIEKFGAGGESVGAAGTAVGQPVYLREIDQARRAGADAILVLLGSVDQIAFLGQVETAQVDIAAVPFPDPIGQTRDYVWAIRQTSPSYTPEHRIQLWETTLEDNGAADFNQRYTTRYSEAADPSAWAAYNAVKVYYDAVIATGSKDPDAVISYLEDPGTELDVMKGPGTSFRPWDHQLRQPLYMVQVNFEVEVHRAELATRLALADLEAELPPGGPTDDPVAWLDQYGDGPDGTSCRL